MNIQCVVHTAITYFLKKILRRRVVDLIRASVSWEEDKVCRLQKCRVIFLFFQQQRCIIWLWFLTVHFSAHHSSSERDRSEHYCSFRVRTDTGLGHGTVLWVIVTWVYYLSPSLGSTQKGRILHFVLSVIDVVVVVWPGRELQLVRVAFDSLA